MISKRLLEIANLINKTDLVVDLGSDHAQLSILLISQNKAKKVINIEKNIQPFNVGVKNTLKYKDRIENILSDGFDKIDKNIKIDYLVIAGMGAKNMVNIVSKSENKIDNIIFCPNNNEHLIREFAYNNFYLINKDLTINDNGVFYSLFWLSKINGFKPKNNKKYFYLGYKKNSKSDYLFKDLCQLRIKSLEKIPNLKKQNPEKYKELKFYKKVVKKWK